MRYLSYNGLSASAVRAVLLSASCSGHTQLPVGDSKNAITLARSSADVSPPYGFILLPGTTDPPPLKWSDLRYVFDIKED